MLVQYVRVCLLDNGRELMVDVPPTLLMDKAHLDPGRSQRPLTPFAGVFRYS